MAEIFDIAFNNLLGWEGGYGCNAKDPGGPTCYGVIQTEYDAYRRKKGLPLQSVKYITLAEAEEIYRDEYWNPTYCGNFDPGVADATFDADVNSGNRRGVTWLQEAINQVSGKPPIPVDGACGEITVTAANACDPSKLIDAMLTLRLAFMHVARHPETGALLWNTFGRGWAARIAGVRVQAHKLAGAEPAPLASDHPLSTHIPIPPQSFPLPQTESPMNPVPTLPSPATAAVVQSTAQPAIVGLPEFTARLTKFAASGFIATVLGFASVFIPHETIQMALGLLLTAGTGLYSLAHGLQLAGIIHAANAATYRLVENLLNQASVGLGGKPVAQDLPADPTSAAA